MVPSMAISEKEGVGFHKLAYANYYTEQASLSTAIFATSDMIEPKSLSCKDLYNIPEFIGLH